MVFSYNWLQSFFKKKLPKPKKLAEILSGHSFEVEEVRPVSSLLSNRAKKTDIDWILDIDVLPNRAGDCFSHSGIARECAALLNYKLENPDSGAKENKASKTKNFVSVEVKHKFACPRYTARLITDVKINPSPKWIQERLKICGLRPINNVVDIANYVMLETGQPLHAFDSEKLEGGKIIVRFAKNGERIITLDDEKYELDDEVLVIADSERPIAIAGIKGGKVPEIDKKTKIIVLESANFDNRIVRRGSKRIDLKTDASLRFEHGLDPNLTESAINRAAFLIQKIAGGRVSQGLVDVYPKKTFPKKIKLDLDYVNNLLGIKISEKEIKNILQQLEFKISNTRHKKENSKNLLVEVPVFRTDISIQEDLIEEIGRIYGYQKIKADFPVSSLIPPKRNLDIFWEDAIKNILREAGFSEVYNYSFFGEKEAKTFGWSEDELIEIENPVSVEQKYLRASLIPNLLGNVVKNLKNFNEIRIFELGKIFKKLKKAGKYKAGKSQKLKFNTEEKRTLTVLSNSDDFYQLKGVADSLLNKLGISDIYYKEIEFNHKEQKSFIWYSKKCAEIKVGREKIGVLGEIASGILDKADVGGKILVLDIDFEKLKELTSEEHEYRPTSRFPAAVRDLAVLVPRGTKVVEILNKINAAGGKIIRDIDVFDIYEGGELPEGKKNLAFHLIYQSEERTLKSEEIDQIHQKIIKILEKNPGWQIRR